MFDKILKLSTAMVTAAQAGFSQPTFYGCDVQLSWSNMTGPIELMTSEGKFEELSQCSGNK